MDYSSIKQMIPLSKLAKERYNFELVSDGRCICPFTDCHSSTGFKVKRDMYFKCYRCNRSGTVADMLIAMGDAKDFSDAFKQLSSQVGDSKGYKLYKQQCGGRRQAFELYLAAADKYPDLVEMYCLSRGWNYSALRGKIGYAPSDLYLQEKGMSKFALQNINLCNEQGIEHYYNHLIFPMYNSGAIVHFTGRSLNPDDKIRWKHTAGSPPINNYLYNSDILDKKDTKYLVIAEGVSDCVSLSQVGEPAVGVLGVNLPIVHNSDKMRHIDYIIAFFDRDRYSKGTEKEGEYKSWSAILTHLVDLSLELNINIWCVTPPNEPGIKDASDFLLDIEFNRDEYTKFVNTNKVLLPIFMWNLYKDKISHHKMIFNLLRQQPVPELEKEISQYVITQYHSYWNYIKELSFAS